MLLAGGGALQLLYVMRTCTTTHTTRPAVLNTCLPRWREGLWGRPERAGRHANARLAFPPRLRLPAALARPFAVARVHTRQEGRCASARGLLPAGSRPRCALPAPKQPRLPSRRMAPRGWLLHTRPSRVKRCWPTALGFLPLLRRSEQHLLTATAPHTPHLPCPRPRAF